MRRYRGLLHVLAVTVLLALPARAVLAVPLVDIPTETLSRFMTGGLNHEFGWTASYGIGLTAATRSVDVALRINLVGADAGHALRAIWERGIEDTWSRRTFTINNTPSSYGIGVDVTFGPTNPHHTVTVHSGTGNANMLNWYTENPSGWPQDRQGLAAAHEAGHMFGNFDEYPGGSVNPDGSFGNVPDSLMGSLLTGALHDRHFQFVVDWAVGKELAHTSVPEPGSIILLVSGAAGLASVAWKRRHRRQSG
jgi:PEP-CTERM motif